jgi:hypothetical protein
MVVEKEEEASPTVPCVQDALTVMTSEAESRPSRLLSTMRSATLGPADHESSSIREMGAPYLWLAGTAIVITGVEEAEDTEREMEEEVEVKPSLTTIERESVPTKASWLVYLGERELEG